jgi:cytochrome d ubiquinol oxidase subunit II
VTAHRPTYSVRETMITNLTDHPWRLIFPLLAVGALAGLFVRLRRGLARRAFLCSALFIVGLLTTIAAGLYPSVLPAREGDPFGLTIDNAIAGDTVLHTALVWWPIGILLAAVYFTFAYRMFFRGAGPPTLGSEPRT